MNVHVFIVGIIGNFLIVYAATVAGYCPAPSPPIEDPTQIPDYYWRDYVGVIPKDAIEGGTDKNGNATYIGQVYIRNKILPAIITQGCLTAKTTANGHFVTIDEDVKILCSQHKENFKWVPARNQDAHSSTDHHFVIGGRTIRNTLYIGRTFYNGRLIIGKVFDHSASERGLAIPYKGKRVVLQTYEVLTYNAGQHQKDPIALDLDIDVRML